MARDYIVRNDQQFDSWLDNFITGLNAHVADFGLVADDLLPIEGESAALDAALAVLEQRRIALTAASKNKMSRRVSTEAVLRPLVRRISGHPAMTDGIRGELGLPVHKTRKGILSVGPEVPGIYVEMGLGYVTVHFGTEPGNEQINGKPAWAKGCNIYRRRAGETEFSLLAFESASPYVDEISGEGIEYTYVVRYRGTRSRDLGAQSAEVTVAAMGMLAG